VYRSRLKPGSLIHSATTSDGQVGIANLQPKHVDARYYSVKYSGEFDLTLYTTQKRTAMKIQTATLLLLHWLLMAG